ncbi:MAG: glycosyltransferase [Alphaproteobacteria bacterium]|nr:glycosyltransferase [Alphaproteobacteria bacterium]
MTATEAAAPRVLLHVFSTFAVGGPQRRFATLVAALGDRYRHRVISLDGRFDSLALLPADAPVARLDIANRKGGGLSPANLRAFRALLRRERPDTLITYNWGSIEWALANRLRPLAPHLHIEDGFGPEEAAGQLPRRVRLRRLALTGRTRVVVPSRTLYDIATRLWRLAPQRVVLVPNGIDIDRFAVPRAAGRAMTPAPNASLTVGTVAALRAEKNIDRMLRVFAVAARERPLRAIIAGGGPELARLQALAAAMGLADAVTFTGPTDRPEAVLAQLDLFLLTSDTEQMPLSLVEAMAAGLPVAATDVGDVAGILSPENRPFVAAPTDETALAAHLLALAGSPEKRAALGVANATRARADYGLDAMVARYDRLFAAPLDPLPADF